MINANSLIIKDFDIDKLYIMMFDINKKGKLQTFTKLQNKYKNLRTAMDLKYPTGIEYKEGIGGTNLSLMDVRKALDFVDTDVFNKVLNSNNEFITFDDNIPEKLRTKFLRAINQHSLAKFSKAQKQSALKNAVVHKILRLMERPLTQISAHKPISMSDLQAIGAKSTLSYRERIMSSDSPLGKFIMQVQNMVGKNVIGITAVSLKVFFAVSTFMNQRIQDFVKTTDPYKQEEYLNDICFIDKYTGELTTLANINLEPLKQYAKEHADENGRCELPFSVYGYTDLFDIIRQLEKNSTKIDCAEAISELLSAATDFCSCK